MHTRHLPARVLTGHFQSALHDTAASRVVEAQALACHAPHELMRRAGTAVARLALAVAPHARSVWVAAGPGNNGGDGLLAASLLQHAGVKVQLSLLGDPLALPDDAAWAYREAQRCGVSIGAPPPDGPVDLVIDALLGLGGRRAPAGEMAQAIELINHLPAPCISVDLPSGLDADTGQPIGPLVVRATHTLALLTLKPGLFTAAGRDHAGDVWLDTLGCTVESSDAPRIRLASAADLAHARPPRPHASHKGLFGDLAVVGGAPGMGGAAVLAAQAAIAAGAGRVFVAMLDDAAAAVDALRPELMFRPRWWLSDPATLARTTVVCGCGGGSPVQAVLPPLLARCQRLLLDADALNALADDAALRAQLDARARRGQFTVMTPHPLEAARLLGSSALAVQRDRLRCARELAQRHACVVVLKGSGTVIATADGRVVVSPSGNALLAGAGSGDVLAGWLGGQWAQMSGEHSAFDAAVASTWLHGRAADLVLQAQPDCRSLPASDLAEAMRKAAASGSAR